MSHIQDDTMSKIGSTAVEIFDWSRLWGDLNQYESTIIENIFGKELLGDIQ